LAIEVDQGIKGEQVADVMTRSFFTSKLQPPSTYHMSICTNNYCGTSSIADALCAQFEAPAALGN
jgi:hypothetical protein